MGVDAVADGATPEKMDEVFLAYLRAKLAAEQDLLARPGLATTVLRPGGLTDDAGDRTGDPGARTSTAAACRGTTSPRYWSPCWTQAPTARSWNWSAATSPIRRLSARWTDGALW